MSSGMVVDKAVQSRVRSSWDNGYCNPKTAGREPTEEPVTAEDARLDNHRHRERVSGTTIMSFLSPTLCSDRKCFTHEAGTESQNYSKLNGRSDIAESTWSWSFTQASVVVLYILTNKCR